MHTNAPSELPVQSLDEARMKRAAWAESNQRTVETSSLNPLIEDGPRSLAAIELAIFAVVGFMTLFAVIGVGWAATILMK
ncbi:MAG TPA: hypothetical protein VGO18_23780 [Steroidobacteraceae bacterium]|jgi:hypothetical protein|nr:hypothetical protein [Steroidobacteraceae bacterium]